MGLLSLSFEIYSCFFSVCVDTARSGERSIVLAVFPESRMEALLKIITTHGASNPLGLREALRAHRDFGSFGLFPMEAEHDDLKAVTPVGPFEKARLDQVLRTARREVNASVG